MTKVYVVLQKSSNYENPEHDIAHIVGVFLTKTSAEIALQKSAEDWKNMCIAYDKLDTCKIGTEVASISYDQDQFAEWSIVEQELKE